jgi:hypothetical protein
MKALEIPVFGITAPMDSQALVPRMYVDYMVGYEEASSLLFQCIVSIYVSADNIFEWINGVDYTMICCCLFMCVIYGSWR